MTAIKQTPCFCQSFEFGEFDGGNEDAISYTTECTQSTARIFAQGHDAKLAGFLVRAELAGEEIRMISGGVAISSDAVRMAAKISEAFQAKVQLMLDLAKARVAKKASKAATKTARKSAEKALAVEAGIVAPEPELAKAKVGRWVYEGAIGPVTKDFVYRAKSGEMKAIPEGKYTLV